MTICDDDRRRAEWLVAAVGVVLCILASTDRAAAQCELATLLADDGASGDDFGGAVAVDGDVAVVGAPEDDDDGSSSGAAYVYRLVDSAWIQEQKLTASDADSFDDFGFAVAVSGDTIVVGSPRDDHASGDNAGSVYVFAYDGLEWVQEAKLTASDADGDDRFGTSVAIRGDTLAVGAKQDDDVVSNSGSAYAFDGRSGDWKEQAKLTADDPVQSAQFGHSIATDGQRIVVGAWQDQPVGMFLVGAAYVFVSRGNTWLTEQKLTASDAADFRWFGQAVAISGEVVLVGAYGDRADDLSESGGAYFYQLFDGEWTEVANVNASDPAANARFGWSVALHGGLAVIGSGSSAPAAYCFGWTTGGDWIEHAILTPGDPEISSEYGYSVAISETIGLVGDRASFSGTGSAFVFDLLMSPDECDGAGCEGDANGDGTVNPLDSGFVLTRFGCTVGTGDPDCDAADMNGDGLVDPLDIGFVLARFGPCP